MTLPPMQLCMTIPSRDALEPIRWNPPPGYAWRIYRPDDRPGMLRVLDAAGFEEWDMTRITEYMRAPERTSGTHVITFEDAVVAATFAARETPIPPVGRLDYVAADPEHKGQGLGLAVCAAVARYLFGHGYPSVILRTDDWRLPAIKTYLKLGFRPKMIRQDMPDRWRVILDSLSWPYDAHWLAYSAPADGQE